MKYLSIFRKQFNYSQQQIANIIGVSLSYYSKIESGNKQPSYNFIVLFKKKFPEVDINIFFDNLNH